jgi:antirestriction protein
MNAQDTTTTDSPRAWVGCLACYNDGRLIGEWLDADGLEDEATLDAICQRPDHEELWVMDHENLIGGEMSPLEAAVQARALEDLALEAEDLYMPLAVAREYIEGLNITDPTAWPSIESAFNCAADSETDFVAEYMENLTGLPELPDWLHIDYAGSFRDLTMDMTVIRHEGTLYVFHNN